MVQAPGAATTGLEFAADRIAMNIHGNADSHIDALCHVSFDGGLYNGVPAGLPSTRSPCSERGMCQLAHLRRDTRRAVRRLVRRATLRDPNMSSPFVVERCQRLLAAAAVSRSCSSLASSAVSRPISTRSSGLMKPSLIRKPPARATASRSGTAQ